MKEVFGNIWKYKTDILCITTNGFVKNDHNAVMGRGVAFQAKQLYPELSKILGHSIFMYGNHVHQLGTHRFGDHLIWIYSFPVKHNWWEIADPELIRRSCRELKKVVKNTLTLLPRPGCNNGKLSWEHTVRCILEEELPEDNFLVITNEKS